MNRKYYLLKLIELISDENNPFDWYKDGFCICSYAKKVVPWYIDWYIKTIHSDENEYYLKWILNCELETAYNIYNPYFAKILYLGEDLNRENAIKLLKSYL